MNLDCETPELAEESLAAILRMDEAELRGRIDGLRFKVIEIRPDPDGDRLRPMLNAIAGREIVDMASGRTCWFHATRVKDLASFRQGIWPLQKNLDRIWNALHPLVEDVVSPEGWNEFRRETVAGNYGGHSAEVVRCWMADLGPYGFLLSESAFNPEATKNHDYLSTSELVEWIAICFKREFRVSLHDRHHRSTRPALIKFWTPGIKAIHLGAALDYLLHRRAGWSLTSVGACHSAEGKQIMPAQLIKAIPMLESGGEFRKYRSYSLSAANDHVPLLV